MSEEEQTLLLIKGAISDLTPEQQQTVNFCAQQMRDVIKQAGKIGGVALALVAAEGQAGRLP